MFFWLKKLLGFWLMPLPFCLALMLAGLVLTRVQRLARLGRGLLLSGFVLLLVFSNGFVSRWLVRPLETRYPAMPEFAPGQPLPAALAACRYVVVLGGGNGNSARTAANNLLMPGSLSRIVEAVRILRALPEAKLVVCGPENNHITHATVLARTAMALGIAPERIAFIEHARDTENEARAAHQLAGDAPVALVTSAWHMPRAVALFRSAGLEPLPCPADFTTHDEDAVHLNDFFWDIAALERSTWAVRERIGYCWIWLRGKAHD
jgi:uncharacterized SAM-binding protein YcdF (DUF218 family)